MSWQCRMFPPHPSLARWVRGMWTLDDLHTELKAEHRLYPECNVLLTFLHGESYLGIGSELLRLPRVYVQECRGFPVRLRSCGPTRLVGVELYPWGAIRLLGALRPLIGNPCSIPAQVPDRLAARIERLLIAGELDEALIVLEQWLLARAAAVDLSPSPALVAAERLLESRGQGTVSALADEASVSVRQLERQFQAQIGMTPKQLARLTRFEAAQHFLQESRSTPSLTRLAHDLGYADQAHFSREFRAFAERSPGGFIAENKDFLRRQGDVAFVQAERSAIF